MNKRQLKLALKRTLVRAWSQLPRPSAGSRCLMYHSVVASEERDPGEMNVPVTLFEHQLEFLRDAGYVLEDAADAAARIRSGNEPDPKSVTLTFDDGYEDNHRLALPVLERFGYRATVFLVADAFLPPRIRPVAGATYLDLSQAREMLASGLISFGCHGATHRNLRELSEAEVDRETRGARIRLEDALGVPITLFAYPFGSFDAWDERTRRAVRRAGFVAAYTSIVGPNTARRDVTQLRRSRMSWAEDVASLSRLLHGGYDWYAAVQWLSAVTPRGPASAGLTRAGRR